MAYEHEQLRVLDFPHSSDSESFEFLVLVEHHRMIELLH